MNIPNVRALMLLAGVIVCGLSAAVANAEIDVVVSAVGREDLIDPLETVEVDMFVNHTGTLTDFAAYQGICEVSGGDSGTLYLTDLEIDHDNPDWVFSSFNEEDIYDCTHYIGYALCAVPWNPTGIEVQNPGYLGTLTYYASSYAQGVFDIDVDTDPDDGTILNDSMAYQYGYLIDDPAQVGVDIECFDDQQCDDANECTWDDCVAQECQFDDKSSGWPCTDDGNDCTDDECDGDGACTHPDLLYKTPCDDGLFCTLSDECDGNGTCVGSGATCEPSEECCEGGYCYIPPQLCSMGP